MKVVESFQSFKRRTNDKQDTSITRKVPGDREKKRRKEGERELIEDDVIHHDTTYTTHQSVNQERGGGEEGTKKIDDTIDNRSKNEEEYSLHYSSIS